MKMLSPTTKVDDADFRRTYRGVEVPPGTTIDDVMRPGFWSHHSDKIQKNDLLDILAADGSLDVQARVTGKKDGLITLRLLRAYQEEQASAPGAVEPIDLPQVPDNYIVNHAPKTGWRVWTKVPSKELVRDLANKPAAIKWAISHAAMAEGIDA